MAANSQQFGVRVDSSKRINEVIHSNIKKKKKLELTSLVRQVALGQVRQVKVYNICSFPDHPTNKCP
jgi:hypothetical protein